MYNKNSIFYQYFSDFDDSTASGSKVLSAQEHVEHEEVEGSTSRNVQANNEQVPIDQTSEFEILKVRNCCLSNH